MVLQVSILPQKRRQAEAVDREHLRGALPSTSSTMGLALSPGMHTASGPSGYRAHSRSTDWCGLQFLTLANQVRRPVRYRICSKSCMYLHLSCIPEAIVTLLITLWELGRGIHGPAPVGPPDETVTSCGLADPSRARGPRCWTHRSIVELRAGQVRAVSARRHRFEGCGRGCKPHSWIVRTLDAKLTLEPAVD